MCLPRLVGSLARALVAVLLLRSAPGAAQSLGIDFVDPDLNWRTLDTAHFSVHFAEQHRLQAQLVAGGAGEVFSRITQMLRWQPRLPAPPILLRSAHFSKRLASPLPFSLLAIFLSA